MKDEDYASSFKLISLAGDSKAESMTAIKEARNGRFEEAEQSLKKARERMNEAHEIQTNLIRQEADGTQVQVNIILVHSQDHLTMAMVAEDLAEEIIELYKTIFEMKNMGGKVT